MNKRQALVESFEHIAIDTSTLGQLDKDTEDDISLGFDPVAPHFLSATKQLPHYFVSIPDREKYKSCVTKALEHDVDLLNGQWSFCRTDAIVNNADLPIPTLPEKWLQCLGTKKKNPPKDQTITKSKMNKEERCTMNEQKPVSLDDLTYVVNNLNSSRAENYDQWTQVMWAVSNTAAYSDIETRCCTKLIHRFSQQSEKYNPEEVSKKLCQQDSKKADCLSFASLLHWLKEDNPEAHKQYYAKDNTYEMAKCRFEEQNWKVQVPLSFVEIYPTESNPQTENFFKASELVDKYRDLPPYYEWNAKQGKYVARYDFIWRWRDDHTKKTYKNMNFLPKGLTCLPTTYNLWRGFQIEQDIANTDPEVTSYGVQEFLDFLKGDICNHDEQVYNYMLKFTAQIFQDPAHHGRIAVVLTGDQGTGKNTFTRLLGQLVGANHYYETGNPELDFFGTFNVALKNRIVCVVNEAQGSTNYEFADLLKHIIDADTITTNQKYKATETHRNFIRLFFCTNNPYPVKVELTDRRYVLIKTSSEHAGSQHSTYWEKIHRLFANKQALCNIYHHLLEVDVTNIDFMKDRPITL